MSSSPGPAPAPAAVLRDFDPVSAPLDPPVDPPVNAQDPTTWMTTLPELLDLLRLEPLGDDTFLARQARMAPVTAHVYGGLVAAQAVVAAYETVAADRVLHSLHAYFLRAGDPHEPITMVVERTRDGRSFTHRRLSAEQHGRAILQVSLSYAVAEEGLSHQVDAPDAGDPEDLRALWQVVAALPDGDLFSSLPGAFDCRPVGPPSQVTRRSDDPASRTDRSRFWMRADGEVPDDPRLQQALLAYASDLHVLDPAVRPHGLSPTTGEVLPMTIDHTMWFHAPVRTDEWWLYDLDSPWAGHGRALARGRVFDASGTLLAEVAQEGLVRLAR